MLILKFVKNLNDSYYNKLLDNYSKNLYNNTEKELSDLFLYNDVYSLGYKNNSMDIYKDLKSKIIDLFYDDISNKNYSKVKYFSDNESINSQILNKLINNKNYDVLLDILNDSKLFSSTIEGIIENSLNYKLKEKIYPQYSYFFNSLNNNLSNLNLLININNLNETIPNKSIDLKKDYFENFFNSLYKTGDSIIQHQENFNNLETVSKIEIYQMLIEDHLRKNNFVNTNDMNNYLYLLIDDYKINQKYNQGIFIVSILENIGFNKNEQYKILKDKFELDDKIFKIFMYDCSNIDSYFHQNNYLYIDENNKIDVSNLNQEKTDLLKELLNNIKEETKSSNQEIMISKLKEHFNFETNEFNLSNLDKIEVKENKNIINITPEHFSDNFISLGEQRIYEFEKKLEERVI